ncbi:MAG: gluconate:H+ symporter [Gemmatimonadota bacterium]|nr:gluconate:H+ symporter [Gemmatimonadota bacterium]
MPLVSVFISIAVLLVLVLVVKLDAFFALIITSFVVGLLNGMDVLSVLQSVLKGIGSTLGSIALILVFGAMLGKLVAESGAARAIAQWLVAKSGMRGIQFAMAATGLLVGLPMLYNAGFIVLIPLVYGLAATTGLPLLYLGIPLASALSVTHGFLPPHPAPTFMAFAYGANVNRTLALGLVAAIPACLVGGIGLSRVLARLPMRNAPPPAGLRDLADAVPRELPGVAVSMGTMLIPVALMLFGALVDAATNTSGIDPFRADYDFHAGLLAAVPDPRLRAFVVATKFLGNANIAVFVAVLVALYTLGTRRGRGMAELMETVRSGVSGIAMILLIIAAGGAFSQVLRDAGVGDYVAHGAANLQLNPLLLAFGIASLMRLAVGSATVAGMTTAGIVGPMIRASGASPELMVLATGAGSLMFSHFNDTGFWMFKEYFNLTVTETLGTWTLMELTVALTGMAMVLLMAALI